MHVVEKAASTNNEIERNRSLVASLTGSSSSARNVNGVIIEVSLQPRHVNSE